MKNYLLFLLFFIPIKSFSSQVLTLDFEKVVSNIYSAYKVKVIDTTIIYNYNINSKCNRTYIDSRTVRIKYIKISNWLTDCETDFYVKVHYDTLTTEFVQVYPVFFNDCKLSLYSITVPWSGIEPELEPGEYYDFYFSDSTEKVVYRAETCNLSHVNILRLNKTFKVIENRNPKLYGSIKTYEFDDCGGIFVLSDNDTNIYYFNIMFNIYSHFEIEDVNFIKQTNRMIYDDSKLSLYMNDVFFVEISMDKFKN